MPICSRRGFLKAGLAAGVLAKGGLPLRAAKGSATDWVTLGKSNVKVTRLAFGTGSISGRVQRELGQDEFTRQVRHAYDSGIRFFETSETYGDMHRMLGVALKGIPRDSYRLMSKVTTREGVDPQAKMKKAIIGHGASVHGLPALRKFPGNKWLEIAMIRMNHRGTKMDAEDYNTPGLGNVDEVVGHVHTVKREGMGLISMKLIGEGAFTDREDRKKAMRFAFQNAGVDSVTVGFKSIAEIDEAIENLNLALA
jgi:hypothetical protein